MAAPKSAQRRLIFIVSRQRIDLYDALRKALSGEPDCEVIIDRRAGERRSTERRDSTAAAGKERRASQRRERIPVDSEIRECGWTVVKIGTWPEVDAARRAT
jgi:hypothetical protein